MPIGGWMLKTEPYEITNVQKSIFLFRMFLRRPQITSSNFLQRIYVPLSSVSLNEELAKRDNSSRLRYTYIQYIHWNTNRHPSDTKRNTFSSSSNPVWQLRSSPYQLQNFVHTKKRWLSNPRKVPGDGAKASLCKLLLRRPRQMLNCRDAGLNPLCSLNALRLSTTTNCSNHHGVYPASPRGFQEAPKLRHTQGKKKKKTQPIKFPWCQGTG